MCPAKTGTVSNGGTVSVNVTDCTPFGIGFAGTGPVDGPLLPANGSANLRITGSSWFVDYSHNGNNATSDVFEFTDASGNGGGQETVRVTITINPPVSPITVSPSSLPTLTAGTPFSQTITSSGGLAPYTYTLQSGTLPIGMSLSGSGVLSGTPTQRGGYSFSVRSTDSTTPVAQFVDKGYTGTVQNPTLTLTTPSGTAIQNVTFSQTLSTSGGVAPYTYQLETGTFPAGITISSAGVVSGTTTAAAGNYPVTIRVTDSSTGPGSYFEVENYTLTVSPPPSVSIAVSPASVSEDGATNLTYTVTRSLNISSPTTVNITTSGTATSGTDYTGGVATVVIPAGATTATITINPNVDGTVEADETVVLSVAAGTGYTVGAPSSATGTILNDDVPTASISVSPTSVAEDGAPNLVYTVTLNQASFSALSIGYTIGGTATNGIDYATIASPLVIPAGNTTGTITVNPTADATIEADETVTLTLNAGTGYTVGVPNSATGTILNDDLPNLVINDVTASEGNSGITNFTFTVSLSAPAGPGGVTFSIATANGTATAGTDYVASTLTNQTIPSGSSTYTFTVLVNGDALNEPSETFFVNVTSVTNAVVVDGQGVGTISNDDPLPSLSINDVTVTEGNSGSTSAVFTVTLNAASGQSVGVNYATADGTASQPADYTNTSGTLTFTPGQTTRTITVPVIGESVAEANETFFVNLSGATNATITDNQGVGTITNDDVPVTVSPGSLTNGTVAAAYNQTVTASGGVAPYSFGVTAGALPAGLTLSSGGILSGTPTAGGTFNFTVTATDSSPFPGPFSGSQAYTLTIAPPTISLPAAALAGGTRGAVYSASITPASGGTAAYAYSVTAGALPGGVTLGPSNGSITGTPNALGTFNFSITATDSSTGTGPYSATQSYSITVIDQAPVASNSSLTVAYNAAATNVPLSLSGGTPTSLAIGSAPLRGTALVSGNTITYQPTAGYAGPDSFTYSATNTGGTSAPATVSITVQDPVITITPSGSFAAAVAAPYTQTFTFNGGAQPWSGFQVTNRPAGLSITGTTSNTVTISGTPTQVGTFTLNVSATDSSTGNGPYTVGQAFNLTVAAPTLAMTPAAGTLSATYVTAFSQTFAASGGVGPYSYAVTGSLPTGLSLSGGTISGSPTVPGSYPITVTATDTGITGTGSPFSIARNYTINVSAPTIVVNPTTVPNGAVAAAYSQTITATGGATPFSFALTAGALPAGVSLATSGALSGTPTASGTFNFTVTATDGNGQTGFRAYTMTTGVPTVVLAATTLPAATAGVAYSSALTPASGGTAPYSYAVTAGALPTGLTLNPGSGAITGTTTVVGTANFSVTATDSTTGSGPFTATRAYSIAVNQGTSTTTLSSSVNPSTFGQSVTFTATVASGAGTPTGTITFKDGATTLGTGTLAGGAATFATSALSVGSHSITAVYGGDVTTTTSTSAALTQTVNAAGTTATLTSSSNPIGFGQPVTFTATVSSAGGTPTGTITFKDGATTLGTGTLTNGTTAFSTAALGAGAHSITAVYGGDTSFAPATSTALSQNVNQGVQIISFTKPVDQVFAPGRTVPLVATGGASGNPVSFTSGTTSICTVSGSTATLLSAGTCSITANQAANASYLAAAPVTQTFTITGAPTTATLTGPSGVINLGQQATFTATVVVNYGVGFGGSVPATGSVSFMSGGAALCSNVALVNGVATCLTAFSTAGVHSITAVYAGNGSTASPSSSPAVMQSVYDQRPRTVEAISRFMAARNNQILSNEPNSQRQVDRLIDAGGDTGQAGAGAGFSGSQSGIAARDGVSSRLGSGPTATDVSRLRGTLSGSASPIADAIANNAAGGPGLAGSQPGALGFGSCGGNGLGIGPWGREGGYPVAGMSGSCPGVGEGGGTVTLGGARFGGSVDGTMRLGFATSLRDMNRAAAESEAQKLAGLGLSVGQKFSGRDKPNAFDIWVEGKYEGFRDSRSNSDIDGHIGLFSVGADYVLNPRLLVGAMVQFDSMQQRSNSKSTDVRGHGWMVGPYVTVRLSENVFWQARGAWGQSSNLVSPFLTYTDSFDSDRWLLSSTLSGRWRLGDWTFRPSASVAYMEDTSKAYADTFGVLIPSVKSTLGQAKAGPEVSYRFDLGQTVIEPHAGAQVIWNFAHDTTASGIGQVGGENVGPSGARGRVELGLRAMTLGGIGMDVSGSYDGIGASGYSATSGKATVRMPLN